MDDIVKRKAYLIAGYLKGSLNAAEQQELDEWIRESEDNRQFFELLTDPAYLRIALDRHDEKKQQLLEKIEDSIAIDRIHRSAWWYVWGRCVVLGVVVAGLFIIAWYFMNKNTLWYAAANNPARFENEQLSGTQQARLLLDDGSVIILLDSVNGLLATDASGKTAIFKENGWLSYHNSDAGDSLYFNTLQVHGKGQHRVVLPDGSRVWLNAGSSLRYPVSFGVSERRVELRGEAYFEVTSQAKPVPATNIHPPDPSGNIPFIVNLVTAAGASQLIISGARFNVQAYPGKAPAIVTLFEGILSVHSQQHEQHLQPRRQALLQQDGRLTVTDQVDPAVVTAWMKDMLSF